MAQAKTTGVPVVADEIVGVTDAAQIMGLSNSRVLQLIRAGGVRAKLLGRDWAMLRRDVERAAKIDRGKPGRPAK